MKIEYEGMKTAGVTYFTNQTTTKQFGWIKYLSPTDLKIRKYSSNLHAHVQCINNQHAKFDYKELEMLKLDYTNQIPSKHFTEKMSKFKTTKMKKKS